MPSVDKRVVSMEFDNAKFESGVKSTMSLVDKLKEKLHFTNNIDDFDKFNKAVNNVNLNTIQDSVDKVSSKFSALNVVATTALATITNQAVITGERLLKSLSVDNIATGYSKYEQSLKSTQTIMAATGDTIDQVQTQLNKLSWYTDETSYSLSDMTSNIAKFTSAGLKLPESTSAMIGIGNAAGLAGASVDDASHAMEGFSKAMALGYMDRKNWNWIETAKMDTMQVKNMFIQAGEAAGTLVRAANGALYSVYDGTKVTAENFANTLSTGKWMTKKVMDDALNNFSSYSEQVYDLVNKTGMTTSQAMGEVLASMGDNADKSISVLAFKSAQVARTFGDALNSVKDAVSSNWMKLFEQIFGNYTESVDTWTTMANDLWEAFVPPVQGLTNVFKQWHTEIKDGEGSYNDFIQGITNSFDIIAGVADKINGVFVKSHDEIVDSIDDSGNTIQKTITVVDSAFGISVGSLQSFATNFKNFTSGIVDSLGLSDDARDDATTQADAIADTASSIQASGDTIEEIANRVIRGDYLNAPSRFDALTQLGYSWEAVQNKVNEMLDCEYRYDYNTDLVDATTGKLKSTLDATAISTDQLADSTDQLTDSQKESTSQSKKNYTVVDNMASVLHGLGSVIKLVKNGVDATIRVTEPLRGFIMNVVSAIAGLLGMAGDATTNFSDWVIQTDAIYKGLKRVTDFITIPFKGAIDWLNTALQSVGKRDFTNMADKINVAAESIQNRIKMLTGIQLYLPHSQDYVNAIDNVKKAFGEFATFTANVWEEKIKPIFSTEQFKMVSNFVITKVIEIGSTIKDAYNKFIIPVFSKGSIKNNIINSFLGLNSAIGKVLKSAPLLGPIFTSFAGDVAHATTVGDSFTSTGSSIKTAWSSTFGWFEQKFPTISKGVLSIISGMKDALSQLTPDKVFDIVKWGIILVTMTKTWKFMDAASSIVVNFGAAWNNLIGILGAKKNEINTRSIKNIAESIAILLGALVIVAQVPIDKMNQALGAMTLIIIELAALFFAIGKIGGIKSSFSIIAISAAVLAIATAFINLSKVIGNNSFGHLVETLGVLIVLMGLLAGLSYAMTKTFSTADGKKMVLSSIAVLVMASAIKTMVSSLNDVSNISSENIVKGLIAIGAIMAELVIIGKVMDKAVDFKGGVGVLGIVLALWIFVGTLKKIMAIDMNEVGRSLNKFITIFAMIYALAGAARLAGSGGLGLGVLMIGVGLSINLMVDAIKALSKLSSSEIDRATSSITSIMFVMSLMIAASKLAGKSSAKAGLMLVGVGASLFIIALAMKDLATLDPAELSRVTNSVTQIMLVMTLLIGISSISEKAYKGVISISILTGVLAVSLFVLASLDGERLLTATKALDATMIILAGTMYVLSKVNVSPKQIAETLVVMGSIIVAVGGLLEMIKSIDYKMGIEEAGSIALLMTALASTAYICSKIKVDPTQILPVAGMIGAIGVVVTALIGVVGLINQLDGDNDFLQNGAITIGQMIGGFIGGIVSGFKMGESDALPKIAKDLKEFSDNLPDSEGLNSMEALSSTMANLADAGLKDNFSKIFGGSTSKTLLEQVPAFAKVLKEFADQTDGITNSDGTKNAIEVAKGLADIQDAFGDKGGLKAFFSGGKQSFADISDGLGAFAGALTTWSFDASQVAKVDPATYSAAVDAAKGLADVQGAFKDNTGIVENIRALFGAGIWGGITTGLKEFGVTLIDFGTVLSGNGGTTKSIGELTPFIEQGVDAAKSLSDVVSTFNSNKSFMDNVRSLFGGSTWSDIDKGLGVFGLALINFGIVLSGKSAGNTSNIDINQVSGYIDTAMGIATRMSDVLKNTDTGNGSMNWTTLGSGLEDFGTNIMKFATSVQGIDTQTVTFNSATQVVSEIGQMSNIVSGIDIGQLGDFSNNIVDLGSNIVTFANDGKFIDTDLLSLVISSIDSIVTTLTSALSTDTSGLDDKFNETGSSAMQSLLDGMTSDDYISRAFNIGSDTAGSFSNGVTDSTMPMYAGQKLVGNFAAGVGDMYAPMYQIGKYAVQGFANGITDYGYLADNAAYYLGVNADRATKRGVDSNSPSKKYYKTGMYCVQGLVNALVENAKMVKTAAFDLGVSAVKSIGSVLNTDTFNDSFSNLEYSPVIKPVVDLSNLNNVGNTVNGLFDNTSYQLAYSAGSGTVSKSEQMKSAFSKAIISNNQNGSVLDNSDRPIQLDVHTEISGREIARSTAYYTRDEINKLNKRDSRMRGEN